MHSPTRGPTIALGGFDERGSETMLHGLHRLHRTARLLADLPLFEGVRRGELETLAPYVEEIERPTGRTLISSGASGHECYLVLAGSLTVSRDGARLGQLQRGDVVGEMALLTRAPRCADVSVADDARLLVLTSRGFTALSRHPKVAPRLRAISADRAVSRRQS